MPANYPPDDVENSPPPDSAAGGTVGVLRRRFTLLLLAIAALVVFDQAVLQPWLARVGGYAPAINVAGRQRMLSQKITKDALAIVADPTLAAARRESLRQALAQFTAAHRALCEGNADWQLSPITSPVIAAQLAGIETDLNAMRAIIAPLVESSTASSRIVPQTAELLHHEAAFLAQMERIVTALESEAQQQMARLRIAALVVAIAVISLLIGAALLVIRPALITIRSQVSLLSDARDGLELRVAERTAELTAANTQLAEQIKQREQSQRRAAELHSALAHASRVTSLGQLATGLAHELNQPLAAIANDAATGELLARRDLPANHRLGEVHARVQAAALRAGGIVRRMRNFLRPQTGQRQEVDLNLLVREVVELCRPELQRHDVRLALTLDETIPPLAADALQLQQVCVNLIHNACQAMDTVPRGNRVLEIATRGEHDTESASQVVLEIRDTGPGFSPAAKEQAFSQFFTTKADGLGIGLAIGRSIVQQHGGSIEAANRDNRGAVIRVTLPSVAKEVVEQSQTPLSEHDAHCVCG